MNAIPVMTSLVTPDGLVGVAWRGVAPGHLRAAGVIGPVRPVPELRQAGRLPPWLGDEDLHRSHRSALVRKDPGFYRSRLGDVSPDLPYVWPGRPPS